MAVDKVLIVCDRGTLDNKAYMNDMEFAEVIQFIGSNEVELRDNYDAYSIWLLRQKAAEEFIRQQTTRPEPKPLRMQQHWMIN